MNQIGGNVSPETSRLAVRGLPARTWGRIFEILARHSEGVLGQVVPEQDVHEGTSYMVSMSERNDSIVVKVTPGFNLRYELNLKIRRLQDKLSMVSPQRVHPSIPAHSIPSVDENQADLVKDEITEVSERIAGIAPEFQIVLPLDLWSGRYYTANISQNLDGGETTGENECRSTSIEAATEKPNSSTTEPEKTSPTLSESTQTETSSPAPAEKKEKPSRITRSAKSSSETGQHP